MPWHIETDRDDCLGYAVIKDDDGALEGCHRTRSAAERQLSALYASEDEDDEQRLDTAPAINEPVAEMPRRAIAEEIRDTLRTVR
jgi:hypothetical protein